jgi:hypothetical protein
VAKGDNNDYYDFDCIERQRVSVRGIKIMIMIALSGRG